VIFGCATRLERLPPRGKPGGDGGKGVKGQTVPPILTNR